MQNTSTIETIPKNLQEIVALCSSENGVTICDTELTEKFNILRHNENTTMEDLKSLLDEILTIYGNWYDQEFEYTRKLITIVNLMGY